MEFVLLGLLLLSFPIIATQLWNPPLAVGRMATDSNKVNQSVTKGKAVIILHTWKDHLWSIGSRGEPPEVVSASAVGDHVSVGDGEGGDGGGDLHRGNSVDRGSTGV